MNWIGDYRRALAFAYAADKIAFGIFTYWLFSYSPLDVNFSEFPTLLLTWMSVPVVLATSAIAYVAPGAALFFDVLASALVVMGM